MTKGGSISLRISDRPYSWITESKLSGPSNPFDYCVSSLATNHVLNDF